MVEARDGITFRCLSLDEKAFWGKTVIRELIASLSE